MADTPDLESVAAIESEIERLTTALDIRKKALVDPQQREARILCRQQDMGRWAERLLLTRDVIQAIRSTVNNHPEIWTAEVLKVDGWVSNEKGWTLPLAPLKGGQGGP